MSSELNISTERHTYKYKLWVHIVNVVSLVVVFVFASLPVGMVIDNLTSSAQSLANDPLMVSILLCVIGPIVAMLAFVLLLMIISTIAAFSAYIRVTPEGIEHKVWPVRHIFARWSDANRLGDFFLYKSLYLQSYKVIGLSLSHQWPWKYFNFSRTVIPLSAFNGWSNGQLAADLKRYAPHLLETPSAPEQSHQVQPAVPETHPSGIDEEDRVLAAFSHAAIVIAGIFIPIIIYAVRKKKSPFLSFQLLQAFYFQLTGAMLAFVLPICGFLGTLIPVLNALSTGDQTFLTTMPLLIMIVWAIFGVMLTVGNIALIAYGLVGAVQTYRGKDFRYAIIGKLLAKGRGE